MKAILSAAFVIVSLTSYAVRAQVDEVSEATGMPLAIGAPVIYGRISIEGLPRGEGRPNIFVTLLISGTQIQRRQTDSRGCYFFLERPRHGHTLLFEIDGAEVGRSFLSVGAGNRLRQDVTLDWKALRGVTAARSGVVVTKGYSRSAEAEKMFDKAMSAVRENKPEAAAVLFNEIVAADPKDHIAWTMLGTIYYSQKKYADAALAFEKAIEIKPDFTLAKVNLGRMEISQKNFDKAIVTLSKAIEMEPASADANHYLGEAYIQIKKGSLAVGFLNKAIELAPVEKAEIHLRLAALYNGAGLKDRAAAEYKAFLKKVPDHEDKKKFEQYIKENTPD